MRDVANAGFGEIDIDRRANSRATDLSTRSGLLTPGRDMANNFLPSLRMVGYRGHLWRPA